MTADRSKHEKMDSFVNDLKTHSDALVMDSKQQVAELKLALGAVERAKSDSMRDHLLLEATHKDMRREYVASVQHFVNGLGEWDATLSILLGDTEPETTLAPSEQRPGSDTSRQVRFRCG